MSKVVRLTERDLTKLVNKIISEQAKSIHGVSAKKPSDFSQFPCLKSIKETTTAKGDRVKVGSGFWKNHYFYSNGRVLNTQYNDMAFFKCYNDGDGLIVSKDPNDEPDV
jgi:hypothetical protein